MGAITYQDLERQRKMSVLHKEAQNFVQLLNNSFEAGVSDPHHYRTLAMEFMARLPGASQEVREESKSVLGAKRWVGIPSNSYIDGARDIISSQAHREYVSLLKNNAYNMPELRYMHIPYPIGVTENVIFLEDSKMILAYGTFLNNDFARQVYKSVARGDRDYGMSIQLVYRDEDAEYDNLKQINVIKRYHAIEYSVLPVEDACNQLTKFFVEV